MQTNVLDKTQESEKNETEANENAKEEQKVDNNRKMSQEKR